MQKGGNDLTANWSRAAKDAKNAYQRKYRANMTEEQKEARRIRHREWQRRNRDKVSEYNRRYWEKIAANAEGNGNEDF